MKKRAHEETWEVREDADTGQHRPGDVFLAGAPRAVLRPFGNARYREDATVEDRARLAASAPEMARLLLELEWDHAECNICFEAKQHAADCRWVAVLRKAGVVEKP